MSEKPTEEQAPAKKKGKLPIIIALVLVLGGGGFFMKSKNGKKEKPKVELGEIVDVREKIVNLKNPNNFAKYELSIQLAKGFEKTKVEAKMAAIEDLVDSAISARDIREISAVAGKEQLKMEIAWKLNKMLADPAEEKKEEEAAHAEGEGEEGEPKPKPKPEAMPKHFKPQKNGWYSKKGPVLLVYLKSFVTR